jgi:hypothetical protein
MNVFDKHQLVIAKRTLNMPDEILNLIGGMTKEEAKQLIEKLERKVKNAKNSKNRARS